MSHRIGAGHRGLNELAKRKDPYGTLIAPCWRRRGHLGEEQSTSDPLNDARERQPGGGCRLESLAALPHSGVPAEEGPRDPRAKPASGRASPGPVLGASCLSPHFPVIPVPPHGESNSCPGIGQVNVQLEAHTGHCAEWSIA